MERLRLLWQLHLDAFGILQGRLKTLWGQGPRDCWRIGLLLLPTSAMPFIWASSERYVADLVAWAVLLIAQVAVVLRHPFKPRKAVIHRLPDWYFWTVQALCASSALFLIGRSTGLFPEPRNRLLQLVGLAYLFSVASLTTTALPPFLAYLEAVADRLGLSRRILSASNLYATGLILGTAGIAMLTSEKLVFFFCVAIALPALIALIQHRTLWNRETAVVPAALSQAGIWLVPLTILVSAVNLLPKYAADSLIPVIVVLWCAWALSSLLVRLRKSPVENFAPFNEGYSAKTEPNPYVETGEVDRLQALISNSDRGIFGLIGVRGAGKSTLIACTVAQLKGQHFTLSITAPVRHDSGVSFLSSVCWALCRQVLDDLHPIFYGKETEVVRAWTEIFVRTRNFVITAALLFSTLWALIEWRLPGKSPLPFWQSASTGSLLEKIGWIGLAVGAVLLFGRPAWRALSSLGRAVANWRLVALYREAQQFLELLSYSEAARGLTLPGLTARYVEFVQSVRRHYNGKLIIAIDELDKVHDAEMVKALLMEIKGALLSKGCYYLISISEDARRAFRKRHSAGWDIFENTFDNVIDIPQMSVTTASLMIARRLETSPAEARIPGSCHFILALAGGGIPREIVRHLSTVSLAHENNAAMLQPDMVATEIFRCEAQDWEGGLAEVEIYGEEAIALRAEAKMVLHMINRNSFRKTEYHKIQNHLEKCLELIDPAGLRRSIVLFQGAAAEKESDEIKRYRVLIDDIQGCLRMMVLTIVCELAWKGDETWEKYEETILAAYRALTDKPALAETAIGEIRALIAQGP